jgi:adenine C2-methylase RlmN of 23S rRNA A2503 and tRNA A37
LKKNNKILTFTLSTVGIIPGIERLRKLKTKIKLYLSVHSPFDKERSFIIPINKLYPIKEVVSECRLLFKETHRTIVANYILIRGLNDSIKHAKALCKLLDPNDFDITLNLLNEIPNSSFVGSSLRNINVFKEILESFGYTVDVQLSKGVDVAGGCGQLAGM